MPQVTDDAAKVIREVERKKSESTAKRYASCIRTYDKWCQTNDVDPFAATQRTVENYLQHKHDADGYAYKTLNLHRAALVEFYKRADRLATDKVVPDPRSQSPRESRMWENPAEAMSMGDINVGSSNTRREDIFESRPDDDGAALTPDEFEELANNVPAPTVRNELLVRLMYQCMLRRGEAARIRLENVDRDAREIYIPAEDSKTGSSHTVYYNASLDSLMSMWWDADRKATPTPDSPYLFVSNKGGRLRDNRVSDIVKEAAENAGLQETLYTNARGQEIARYAGHAPRRAGATRLWNNGADIYTVKEALNHDSVETTKNYLNLTTEDLGDKVRSAWNSDDD